jgi:hypothetical protein
MSAGWVGEPTHDEPPPQSKPQSPVPHLASIIWQAESPVHTRVHELLELQSTVANWHADRPSHSTSHAPPSPQTLLEVWHADVAVQSRPQPPAPASRVQSADEVVRQLPATQRWSAVHAVPLCQRPFASQS